jgi:hypothetical protein
MLTEISRQLEKYSPVTVMLPEPTKCSVAEEKSRQLAKEATPA